MPPRRQENRLGNLQLSSFGRRRFQVKGIRSEYVLGYTAANDFSARDLSKARSLAGHVQLQMAWGFPKNFRRFRVPWAVDYARSWSARRSAQSLYRS